MDVKWIKISTDMFDNKKIKHLRSLPEGNNIVLIWVMLLTMAGKCNANGMIFLTETFPYSPEMLAEELGFELNTVKLALNVFQLLGMVTFQDDYISITGWEEHQNVKGLAEIREYNRIKKQESRARQKQLACVNDNVNDMSMTCQECQDTDIDIDIDKDIDIEKENNKKKNRPNIDLEDLFSVNNIYGELREAVENWIAYKAERGFKYKERGLNTLLKQISRYRVSFGESAVMETIEQSIASGYQGIVFDKLKKQSKGGQIDWANI